MADGNATGEGEQFTWHPVYAGRTIGEVTTEIAADLAHDQRSHALSLNAAEQHESQVLASVIALERRWGVYDLDWAETDPQALAVEIAAFEFARDRARDLFTWSTYRATLDPPKTEHALSTLPWWKRLFSSD